jgi:hypothetical protein
MISPKAVTARWLLLCALTFGLVGMHHLSWMSHPCGTPAPAMSTVSVSMSATTMPRAARTTNQPDATPRDLSPGHGTHHDTDDLLHLCLVILAAGLVLAGLWSQWRRSAGEPADTRLTPLTTWPRPPHPPPVPSSLLISLGVLRV